MSGNITKEGIKADLEWMKRAGIAGFQADITSALKPGVNNLEIRVTNLWVNRLIGDQQPNAAKKYAYTAMQFYQADSPLLPSGLLGPVQIVYSSENLK